MEPCEDKSTAVGVSIVPGAGYCAWPVKSLGTDGIVVYADVLSVWLGEGLSMSPSHVALQVRSSLTRFPLPASRPSSPALRGRDLRCHISCRFFVVLAKNRRRTSFTRALVSSARPLR